MSTSEEIPLQGADGKEAEAGIQPESLEQDDTADTIQDGSKGKAPTATVGRWMKLFIAVMSLIAFALLTTGISMITPFYPIVVSCINSDQGQGILSTMLVDLNGRGERGRNLDQQY